MMLRIPVRDGADETVIAEREKSACARRDCGLVSQRQNVAPHYYRGFQPVATPVVGNKYPYQGKEWKVSVMFCQKGS